jgi:hypothetical protein
LLARTTPAKAAAPAVRAASRTASGTVPRPAAARPSALLWLALTAIAVAVTFGIVLLTRKPAPPEAGRGADPQPLVAQPLTQPPAPATAGAATVPTPAPEPAPEPERPAPAEEPKPVPPPTVVAPRVATATAPPVVVEPAPEPEPAAPAVIEPAPPPPPPIAAVFETRRAAEFHVDPEDALVTIDGRPIGKADDWDDMGGGKQWVFTSPGEHLVELSLAGYRTAWIRIVVRPDAKRDVVDIDTDLEEIE